MIITGFLNFILYIILENVPEPIEWLFTSLLYVLIIIIIIHIPLWGNIMLSSSSEGEPCITTKTPINRHTANIRRSLDAEPRLLIIDYKDKCDL